MKTASKIKAKDLIDAYTKDLDSKRYVVMTEVNDETGHGASRRADLLIADTWPSGKDRLAGYEVKVSRQDWLKEIKDPLKSDTFLHYCSSWYLMVPDMRIIKSGELPEAWGLIVVDPVKGYGRTMKAAPIRKTKLEEWPVPFVLAMLRCAGERAREVDRIWKGRVQDEVQKEVEYLHERGKTINDHKLENLQNQIKEFESKTGMKLHEAPRIKQYVAVLETLTPKEWYGIMRHVKRLKEETESMDKAATLLYKRVEAIIKEAGTEDADEPD